MLKRIFYGVLITSLSSLALFIFLNEFTFFSLAFFSSLLLMLILGLIFAKSIIVPLSRITNEEFNIPSDYKEISLFLNKLKRQDDLIERQMKDLKAKQEEFKTITDNMLEGLVLVDKKAEIIFLNKSAEKFSSNFSPLGRSAEFNKVVSLALKGEPNRHTRFIGDKVFAFYANPVFTDKLVSGVVIFILDVTEREKREEMRREFSSNVSHELKTPLTAVMGISELLMNGMIKTEDIPSFAKNIYDESSRLLTLVNDIIKVSRLDETNDKKDFSEVDLLSEAEEVVKRLKTVADKREISLCLEGEATTVLGDKTIIGEIIYNLVDNAIKYNKEQGQVLVSIGKNEKGKYLTVKDTGIGIPAEHKDRIFERFYRVDKSRSTLIGGTGLGLSIVKHGAEYLGAKIKVESVVNKGTSISVYFN